MDPTESVSEWIEDLRAGGGDSAARLWERYFRRLAALSAHRLPTAARRDFDEEDVAASALKSFCAGVQAGRFPRLDDRDDLWSLLVVITARKISHRIRARLAARRGGGAVRGESVFEGGHGTAGIRNVIGNEPTPELAAEFADEAERLFSLLEDPSLREMAALKAEGRTNDEIAGLLDCGLRTVERRLALVRRIWTDDLMAREE